MSTTVRPQQRDPTHLPIRYVYLIYACGYPFYIGRGKDERLSDRPNHVARRVRNTALKRAKHHEVVISLWALNIEVCFVQISERQTQDEAITQENELIMQCLRDGYFLAQKPSPVYDSPGRVVEAVLSCKVTSPFVRSLTPIEKICCATPPTHGRT